MRHKAAKREDKVSWPLPADEVKSLRALWCAVIAQALKDILHKNEHAKDASRFMLSEGCEHVCDWLGLDSKKLLARVKQGKVDRKIFFATRI